MAPLTSVELDRLIEQLTDRGHYRLAYILHVKAMQQEGRLSVEPTPKPPTSEKGVAPA